MGKGMLLELEGRKAVVLTPQGEFKRVSLPPGDWDIGSEIEYAEPTQSQSPWARWSIYAAAAVLVLLLSPVGYEAWALNQTAAIMTVDINPSIQLSLNKRAHVLKAEGLNQDGVQILQGVDWKRQPVERVVSAVTARAIETQKLDPADESGAVILAVSPKGDRSLAAAALDTIREKATTAITAAVEAKAKDQGKPAKTKVIGLEATPQERAKAEKEGLSQGKSLILEDIKDIVPDVKPEQLIKEGPGKLLKGLGINPSEIFSESEQKHGGKPDDPKDKKDKDKNSQGGKDEPAKPATGKPADPKPPEDKPKGPDNKGSQNDGEKGGSQIAAQPAAPGSTAKPVGTVVVEKIETEIVLKLPQEKPVEAGKKPQQDKAPEGGKPAVVLDVKIPEPDKPAKPEKAPEPAKSPDQAKTPDQGKAPDQAKAPDQGKAPEQGKAPDKDKDPADKKR